MNFLREYEISDDTINRIKENNDESILYNLIFDSVNVGKVIDYFRSVKIEVVDELLVCRPELFSIDISRLKIEFNKYNINILVNLINEDINAINFI